MRFFNNWYTYITLILLCSFHSSFANFKNTKQKDNDTTSSYIFRKRKVGNANNNVNNYSINGSIIHPLGYRIKNAFVQLYGTYSDTSITDAEGNYNLTTSQGNCFIRPYKNIDNQKSKGITTIDIALIQAHILAKTLLNSPYKLLAADVNHDGKINTIDIVYIKRLILGLDTSFPGNNLWAFVDSGYKFPNPNNPFPYKDSIVYNPINGNQNNQGFIGVKLGDVNFDWKDTTTINKQDTLTVMAYNVLYYGNGCQGPTSTLNNYFRSIVQYIHPDLMSCEKMKAFSPTATGAANYGNLVVDSVLNVVFPNTFAMATPTNLSKGPGMSPLFYNKQKLTYLKTETLAAITTDFNLYKLFYNDPNLAVTHDTTFLYVITNHTESGSTSTPRDQQIVQEMQTLRSKFTYLPNVINMGDFNTRNSSEPCYQTITNNTDSSTRMSDPPFTIDSLVSYPLNWDNNPTQAKNFLTTSTRSSGSIPNGCGTSGGAKSWYDHIFISPWLVSGKNYMQYIPNSYKTIGNDGNRINVDINSTSPTINNSAPTNILNALFQFSNKYPITIKLLVNCNRNGVSPVDPVEH